MCAFVGEDVTTAGAGVAGCGEGVGSWCWAEALRGCQVAEEGAGWCHHFGGVNSCVLGGLGRAVRRYTVLEDVGLYELDLERDIVTTTNQSVMATNSAE